MDGFTLAGRQFEYYGPCRQWRGERRVELPIAIAVLSEVQGRIIEVGNVLGRYLRFPHVVVDKYEQADGVTNADVVDYQPKRKAELVISISTLEHVGLDEDKQEPHKILRALENMKTWLIPRGRIVVTLPVGYNRYVDTLLDSGELAFDATYYLRRFSHDNQWQESDWQAVRMCQYGSPFRAANGLVIGVCGGRKLESPGLFGGNGA